jgi:REP-associated tyrosine transposase
MARPLRIEYAHAVYHVTSRGNARSNIFQDDEDKERFLSVLEKVTMRYHWLCHAYCLMENHYHLLIETPEANLSRGMRQLNGVYTQTYNRRHLRPGHIFQGRFRAIVIERESYLLELCRYIVLNPVRAKIVETPRDWKWSSYAATVGIKPVPDFLTIHWILSQWGSARDRARRRYQDFVKMGIGAPSPWSNLQGQVLLGKERFAEEFKELLADREEIKEIPRRQRYANRPNLAHILSPGKIQNKGMRNRLVVTAHLQYGYTLKEIAEYLKIHYTTVSKILKDNDRRN